MGLVEGQGETLHTGLHANERDSNKPFQRGRHAPRWLDSV